MNQTTQQLEALLLTAGEEVAKKDLAQLLNVTPEALEQHLAELNTALAGHGVSLVVTATHAQLTTSPAVSEFLAAFLQEEAEKLSKAAAETLAIIAYRGPLSRYDVDVLRGVDSRSMIRQLVRRGVIQQARGTGATPLYDIAPEFLLNLGIERREDLPNFAELSEHTRIQEILEANREQS